MKHKITYNKSINEFYLMRGDNCLISFKLENMFEITKNHHYYQVFYTDVDIMITIRITNKRQFLYRIFVLDNMGEINI